MVKSVKLIAITSILFNMVQEVNSPSAKNFTNHIKPPEHILEMEEYDYNSTVNAQSQAATGPNHLVQRDTPSNINLWLLICGSFGVLLVLLLIALCQKVIEWKKAQRRAKWVQRRKIPWKRRCINNLKK